MHVQINKNTKRNKTTEINNDNDLLVESRFLVGVFGISGDVGFVVLDCWVYSSLVLCIKFYSAHKLIFGEFWYIAGGVMG